MATPVVRFQLKNAAPSDHAHWGVLFGERIALLDQHHATTGDFVRQGMDQA